jgi:hypothetical protein
MRNQTVLILALVLYGCNASVPTARDNRLQISETPHQPPVTNPSLCQLSNNRAAYADSVLTVEGELLVTIHGSTIEDRSCNGGIPIRWNERQRPALREFNAVARGAGFDETIRVRVTGEIRRAERSEFVDDPYWYLDLRTAEIRSREPNRD